MSVLIKGMEKPKRCAECPIYFAGLCSVRLQNGKCPLDGTPEWCPMIEIKDEEDISNDRTKEGLTREECADLWLVGAEILRKEQ